MTRFWRVRNRAIPLLRPLVMGVVNTTPDSFSDGGMLPTAEAAVRHGRELVASGADIVDIGGESTRPGADPVDTDEEIERTIPVVERLASDGLVVSIDTTKPVVARAALDAGAVIVNDVSGMADPDMRQ
ncbi:MAG: dihydropteroate synthase, partial [Acidimicrobiia bacterium]